MSARHAYAVQAVDSNDVFELCKLLALSARDALDHQVDPHNDPAVRLVAQHIAFVLNGDINSLRYYQDTYAFCVRQMEKDRMGLTDQPDKEKDDAPVHKAS